MLRKALSSTIGSAATVVVLLLVVGGLWAYVFAEQGGADATVTPATSSSSPSSESSSSTSAPVEQTWSMGDARDALALEDSNVLVLGDSTGNGKDEWTSLWAQSMETPVARWDSDTESGYLGESDRTRIWSGAMFKATADYPAEHEEIWPAQDPDLVLLSYGHFHESGEEATAAFEELRTDLAKRFPDAPIVVVLQNPGSTTPTRTRGPRSATGLSALVCRRSTWPRSSRGLSPRRGCSRTTSTPRRRARSCGPRPWSWRWWGEAPLRDARCASSSGSVEVSSSGSVKPRS